MYVLVGCEESGVVRRAFRNKGHDAYSNDLVPARDGGCHLQMDVMEAITNYCSWDIIILHPDCTHMALSGNRWYGKGSGGEILRQQSIVWTTKLWKLAKKHAKIGCAIENPTGVLWKAIGKPQYIQPHQFGHGETKKTGILTDRLPELIPTDEVAGREQKVWKMTPRPTRKRDRSETYKGIAEAMADQWGGFNP